MNYRVLKLRKESKLSQEKFGEKLGITGAAVSRIESGDRSLTEQMIKSICREFDVNEEWLRTGEGEIFIKADDDFAAAVAKIFKNEDEFIKNMFIEISKWTEEDREIIKKATKIIKRSSY